MDLINATRMQAGYTMGREPSGRELLVIVIKGTFALPRPGEEVRLADQQLPFVMADTFTGEAGSSAPVYEADFAPRKPACDVLLLGSAHAPEGSPATRVPVELRVGPMRKSFDVVGNRVWRAGVGGVRASDPEPFLRMPISYDFAFGGTDCDSDDPAEHGAYLANPVGRGYRRSMRNSLVDGKPLPNTEDPGHAVRWPTDSYRPLSFGPVGRGWSGRKELAGTYDQKWLDSVFPFLPADFDDRYFQAAPPDQQLPAARGPIEVVLSNLTPDGRRHFLLPAFDAPVHVFPRRGEREDFTAVLDTMVFEPDEERFTMTWRVTRPLKRDMFEVLQVLVGRKGGEWWQQRAEPRFPVRVVMVPAHAVQDAPQGADA